jgi:hypothetical protein
MLSQVTSHMNVRQTSCRNVSLKTVCGVATVREYAEQQIEFMERVGDAEQTARWVFFRDIPSSTACDLLHETLPFVEKYRKLIDFNVDGDQLIAAQSAKTQRSK